MIHLVEKYLTYSKHSDLIEDFRNNYLSHPNYPSLLAITDGLTQLEVENLAANIPFKYLDELPNYFITELTINGNKDFYTLKKIKEKLVIENDNREIQDIDVKALEEVWTGNSLLIENNTNAISQKQDDFKKVFYYGALFIVCCLLVYTYQMDKYKLGYFITSLAGLILSIQSLRVYFGGKDKEESKFCSLNESFSCNSIINSEPHFLIGKIEIIDLPILFFSYTVLTILFNIQAYPLIGVLSTFSLPVIFYSIYLQKVELKKWCFICLTIAAVVALNALVFVVNLSSFNFSLKNDIWLKAIILFAITFISWIEIKKLIVSKKENIKQISTLLRFKRNSDIFYKASDKIGDDSLRNMPKMVIGNPDAKNTLILFLSPSCPHCHKAYEKAKEFLSKYSDKIKVEIAYNLNVQNVDNPYLDVTKTIIHLYYSGGDFIKSLDEWHIERKDMEDWKEKWLEKNSNDKKVMEVINQQFQWCSSNGFNYAPVKIFNDYEINSNYDIDDLFFFFED